MCRHGDLRPVACGGPLRFAWPPCFFVSAGFRPRLAPPWIGRAPAAKLSRYGAGRPHYRNDIDKLGKLQRRATKMVEGL